MTNLPTPEAATAAIMNGDFDHWGEVTVRSGPVVECGVCDYATRLNTVCTRTLGGGAPTEEDWRVVGTFGLQLHLAHDHLDAVIEALGSRT